MRRRDAAVEGGGGGSDDGIATMTAEGRGRGRRREGVALGVCVFLGNAGTVTVSKKDILVTCDEVCQGNELCKLYTCKADARDCFAHQKKKKKVFESRCVMSL